MNEVSLKLSEKSVTTIKRGSKSFSFAGMFLAKEQREAAYLLYMWCRHVDDAVDEAPSKEEALKRLEAVREGTVAAIQGVNTKIAEPYVAFAHVFKKYKIPEHYPLELIEGMAMDVRGDEYQSFEGLHLYCYRVAGVVGLMMSHVIGISDEEALKNACDMGCAMQLTNISRDVVTDFRLGRVYLPLKELKAKGIPRNCVASKTHRKEVLKVVEELLKKADELYQSGDKGLVYLNWKTAIAIKIARNIYSDIGRIVLSQKSVVWESRAHTSFLRKIYLAAKSIFQVAILKIKFKSHGWERRPIDTTWRFG